MTLAARMSGLSAEAHRAKAVATCGVRAAITGPGYRFAHPGYGSLSFIRHGSLIFIASICMFGCNAALAAEADDDAAKPASAIPNMYLDLRTIYSTVPAGAIGIGGFGGGAISTAIQTLQTLTPAANNPLPSVNLSTPSSRSVSIDLPATIDISDRVSLYGGVTASTTQTDMSGWSSLAVTSWHLGFQADLYQQNGGVFPTATLQTTVTRAVPDGPLATTTFTNILEFDYALNEDETRGWLAGLQYNRIDIDTPMARIGASTGVYVGAYYQWPSNWKVTGRLGVQHFGGAQILNFAAIEPFTQPVVRFDLDRMDDNDNRLFGITAQVAWIPKPSYQLTLRTPLYLVRN
jgi:hypothetical protein